MDREEIARKFETLKVWQRGEERAPHKPLLVLYAIGKLLRGEGRLLPFHEVDERLGMLLQEFGPNRQNFQPLQPFWRLQNDGVWEIPAAYKVRLSSSGDARKSDLDEHNVSGGFTEDVARQLIDDPDLTLQIVHGMLSEHFPPSVHKDILQAVGIEMTYAVLDWNRRNADFQEEVLKAYEYRCAVCSFDVRMRHQPVALDAAHIKWQQAGGPNVESNGLALCVLHQRLFDRGAFTLSNRLRVIVSEVANGFVGFQEWLMRYHGQALNFPQRKSYYPDEEYICWHVKEVFQGKCREL